MKGYKKILGCIALVLILSLTGSFHKVYGEVRDIIGYFTSKDMVENKFTIGNIDISIDETFTPPTEWDGTERVKEVRIENNSTQNALVRVSITPTWKDENGNPFAGDNSFVELNFENIDNGIWVDGKDGYYYYSKVLPKGEKTENILSSVKVTIPKELESRYKGKELIVKVDSESVQPTKDAHRAVWSKTSDLIKEILDNICYR